MSNESQWARVPEWVAYKGLDATAWSVLVILGSKAGRERVVWISQGAVARRIGVHRTAVGKAIRRLERAGVIERAGRVVVDRDRGTWVRRYRIVDTARDQAEVPPRGSSADERSGGSSVQIGRPDEPLGIPDERLAVPDEPPGGSHSVPLGSVPHRSVARFEDEREEPNHNGQTPNPAAKEQAHEVREFTEKIGTYSRFDPANPKDRAILCIVPGCGKYNHRRKYCGTHGMAEILQFIEKAAEGGSV